MQTTKITRYVLSKVEVLRKLEIPEEAEISHFRYDSLNEEVVVEVVEP